MAIDIASVRASAAKAALNPALWPETLWRVSQLIGSDMTLFEHIDKATGRLEHGFTDRPDLVAATREAYQEHYYAINPRYEIARARASLHDIAHDDLLGDERTLDRHEFYADFLRPCGLKYFIGSAVADDAVQTVTFSLQRNADRGRVTEQGRSDFAAILPDIRNAMAIYLRMVHAPPFGAALAAALDRFADPMAVVRADGRLLFANRVMLGLIAAGDILRFWRGGIKGASPPIQHALLALFRDVGEGDGLARAIAAGPAGPLILRLAPLAPDHADGLGAGHGRCFCLIIDDPARPHWPQIDEAMALFGLTRCEATVGTHLAAGLGIDDIARRLAVSRNTVRSHLAVLRDKLGVRSALAVAAGMRRAISPFA